MVQIEEMKDEVDQMLDKMRGKGAYQQQNPAEVEDFLSSVDRVSELVSNLKTAETDEDLAQAKSAADNFVGQYEEKKRKMTKKKLEADDDDDDIETHVVASNKSSLNTNRAFSESAPPRLPPGAMPNPPSQRQQLSQQQQEEMSQQAFMAAMEKDAEERYQRRLENAKISEEWKEKGNAEFNSGNFEKAEELYSEALGVKKDNTALWTNRAQARIKLGKYSDALSDCDWALRVFENCSKAYIHRGRAYLGLKEFDKAEEAFRQAASIESGGKGDGPANKLLETYLKQVEEARTLRQQEKEAADFAEAEKEFSGDVADTIARLKRVDHPSMYYAGGFRVLALKIKDISTSTLFRTNGGFDLFVESHLQITAVLTKELKDLIREEMDFLDAVFDLMTRVCAGNVENQRRFTRLDNVVQSIFRVLQCKGLKSTKESAVNLLFTVSETQAGRESIVGAFDNAKILAAIFVLVRFAWGNLATQATSLLNNLALDDRFKKNLRATFSSDVIPPFEALIGSSSISPSSLAMDVTVVPSVLATMANLAGDPLIRKTIVVKKEIWDAVTRLLENAVMKKTVDNEKEKTQVERMRFHSLGFLINACKDESEGRKEGGARIGLACAELIKMNTPTQPVEGVHEEKPSKEDDASTRALILLGLLLPSNEDLAESLVSEEFLSSVIDFLRFGTPNQIKSASKVVAAALKQSSRSRTEFVGSKKGLSALVTLLKEKDDMIVGNAALGISLCSEVPKVAEKLTKTQIVKHLLTLARDLSKPEVRENCAILLAKLAQKDPRHLEKLRELHGIEILHDCMKFIKH